MNNQSRDRISVEHYFFVSTLVSVVFVFVKLSSVRLCANSSAPIFEELEALNIAVVVLHLQIAISLFYEYMPMHASLWARYN
jgi:hypothetical protein